MVRKIKVSDVIESPGTQEEAAPPTTTQEPATPEPEEHVNTEPTNVAVFETTPELPPTAVVEAAGGDATAELPTPKPKRSPRKKKEKAEEVKTMTTTPPPTSIDDPPVPETEHPAEEIKISPQRPKRSPGPNPRPKRIQHQTSQHTTTRVRGLDPRHRWRGQQSQRPQKSSGTQH